MKITQKSEIIIAHKCSTFHKKQIEESKICGCFYCLYVFTPQEIKEWVDIESNNLGQTALCPQCGIDSVIGSASGFPITIHFLETIRDYWFKNISTPQANHSVGRAVISNQLSVIRQDHYS